MHRQYDPFDQSFSLPLSPGGEHATHPEAGLLQPRCSSIPRGIASAALTGLVGRLGTLQRCGAGKTNDGCSRGNRKGKIDFFLTQSAFGMVALLDAEYKPDTFTF